MWTTHTRTQQLTPHPTTHTLRARRRSSSSLYVHKAKAQQKTYIAGTAILFENEKARRRGGMRRTRNIYSTICDLAVTHAHVSVVNDESNSLWVGLVGWFIIEIVSVYSYVVCGTFACVFRVWNRCCCRALVDHDNMLRTLCVVWCGDLTWCVMGFTDDVILVGCWEDDDYFHVNNNRVERRFEFSKSRFIYVKCVYYWQRVLCSSREHLEQHPRDGRTKVISVVMLMMMMLERALPLGKK